MPSPRIETAQLLPEDKRILLVEDENLNRYFYFISTPGSTPIFGYPYVAYDLNSDHEVHMFIPLPSGNPFILQVKSMYLDPPVNPVTSPHTEMS